MTFVVSFLAFLLGAAFATAYLGWAQVRHERRVVEAARARENVAHNRLIGAWKDGYAVPPEPQSRAVPADEQTAPLIPELQDLVDDWDTPSAKAAQMQVIRERMQAGKSQAEIARELLPIEPEIAVEGASA